MKYTASRGEGIDRTRIAHTITLLVLSLFMARTPGAFEGEAMLAALREGGHVIYFRHAQTDWSQSDLVLEAGDWTSCDPSHMRQLSAEGLRTAKSIGEAMRRLRIPIDRVYASEYCRCVQTAEALDLAPVEATKDILNVRSAEYVGGRDVLEKAARRRLSTPPPEGMNTVLVGHGNVFLLVAGARPPEAGAAVVRPDGAGRFTVMDILSAGDWASLAEALGIEPDGRVGNQ